MRPEVEMRHRAVPLLARCRGTVAVRIIRDECSCFGAGDCNMQLFIAYCFSFQPERVPFITFARAMQRDRLLEESERGDRIALVGTKLAIPSGASPGRLLG